jgi:cellulose synthase operon protein C
VTKGIVEVVSRMNRCKAFGAAALLSAGLAVAASAYAQVERKRADLDVDAKSVESELAKKKQQTETPKLNRSSVFVIEVEKQIIDAVKKTVPVLKRQAAKMPPRSLGRLNLLEKAINLNFELAVFLRNEEEREYDNRWQQWDFQGRRGREPNLNINRSKSQWQLVISESKAIMSEFPKGRNADRIIFFQAMALQQLGQEKEAAQIFSELIQKFPNSEIASEAYSQLGDYFFDRNDFGNAANNYKKVITYPNSKRFLWSVFKLGWCAFNTGRYKEALGHWQKVVAIARQRKDIEGGIQLRDQALRDMVYGFAELQMVDPAIDYYRKNGGTEYIGPLLTMLSQTFAGNGQFGAAIRTLKRFQQIEPNHPDGPNTQKEVISLYYALGKMEPVWAELKRFGELYGPKSSWAAANQQKNPKVVKETQVLIKDQLLTYSKLTHKEAIKDGGRGIHEQSRIGYLLFLQTYPGAKEEAEVKYNLADIEYFLKDYRKSGAYYLDIVRMGPPKAVIFGDGKKKDENIHRQSALYMIDSYAKDFEAEFKVMQKSKPDFKKKPSKLSVRAANYVNACATFAKFYAQDKKIIKTCDLDVTKIFFHSNNLEKSRQYLRLIAIKYPNDKEGPDSARQLIRLYAGDDAKVLGVAQELLKIPVYAKGDLGKELRDLQTNIEIGGIEKITDTLKKAREYEDKAKKYPKNPDVDKLWFNAAVNYAKAGEVNSALNAYLVVAKKFPKFDKAKDAYLEIAGIYERKLEFKPAVQYYGMFVKDYAKDPKEIAGGMSKACELTLAMNAAASESNCIAFAQKFPDGAKGFIERLISAAERENRLGRMTTLIRDVYFRQYKLNSNEKIAALYRIYNKMKGQNGSEAAREILGIARGDAGISGEALRYVAELQFKQVDGESGKFSQIKLVGGTVDRLAASIDQKAAALVQLKNTYERVFAVKDPYWGVAALYRIGSAFEQLSNELSDPPAIQGAQKEEVAAQLAPKAAELKKEAANWYKIAEDTVYKFRVFNDWTPLAFNGISRIQGKNLSFEEYYIDPDYVGSEVSSTIASGLKSR